MTSDEYLMLSGLQHFAFCRRQWALIHIEQQWQENFRTLEGQFLHERAHETGSEKRGKLLIIRNLPILSHALCLRGACDVVEFHVDPKGISLRGKYGQDGTLYRPVPIEYKRGKPKEDHADLLQLCAQAMCLEEMLVCDILEGYLFYGEIKRRLPVQFTPDLRNEVSGLLQEMRMLYARGYTPKVKTGKHCRSCSLVDICLPKLCKSRPVSAYLEEQLKEANI